MFRATAVLLALALAAGALHAAGLTSLQFAAVSEPVARGKVQAAVYAGGIRILSLTGPGAKAEADNIAARLTQAAIRGTPPDQVVIRGEGASRTLAIGGVDLITIDKKTAFAAGSTLEGLAASWHSHIQEAFRRPYLSVPIERAVIPVGETRRLALRGNLPSPPQAVLQPAGLASVVVEPTTSQVAVTGAAPGPAQLLLTCGPATLTIPLQVMKYAGRIPTGATAQVTGAQASAWMVARAARAAAALGVQVEPGAEVVWGETRVPGPTLAGGTCCMTETPLTITGEGYLPVTGRVPVAVSTLALPPQDAAVLMVSNNPERLRAQGLWYEARLEPTKPARFLFHHVNSSGATAELHVEVANLSQTPARLRVIESSAGPSTDEIWVGHVAAAAYMARQRTGTGFIVTVPPGMRYLVSRQTIPNGQVASGVDDFTVLEGQGLTLRLRLAPPGSGYIYSGLGDYRPSQVGQQFVFPSPTKTQEASYTLGGNWAFVTVGRHAIAGERDGEKLRGNYGVFYDVRFTLNNPTDRAAVVELGVMAAGGPCRAVVVADGRQYETGLVTSRGEQMVASFPLAPRSTRVVPVRIMPQSGSNYPIWLLMREAGYRG